MVPENIIRRLSDEILVANLNLKNADLDVWVAEGFSIEDPALAEDRALVAALREEYRRRTGEVI